MVCTTLAFIDGLGAPEMMLIFVIVLVLFGGNKLPEFARGLGKSIREFKKAAAGVEEEFKRALEEDERKQNQPKLAEPATTSTPASPYDPAGPGAGTEHYDHDYHSADHTPAEDISTPAPPAETTPAPPPAANVAPAVDATLETTTPTPAPAPPPPPPVPPEAAPDAPKLPPAGGQPGHP